MPPRRLYLDVHGGGTRQACLHCLGLAEREGAEGSLLSNRRGVHSLNKEANVILCLTATNRSALLVQARVELSLIMRSGEIRGFVKALVFLTWKKMSL